VEVSWLPGRALDRNSATTAMTLADLAGERDPSGPTPRRDKDRPTA